MGAPGALTLLAALLGPGAALACTCMWVGPFTKVALGSQLVVLAEVRSHERRRMERTPEHDYGLSVCGEFWLEVRGDQAVGRITTPRFSEGLQSAALAEVLAWIRSGGTAPLTPRTLAATSSASIRNFAAAGFTLWR